MISREQAANIAAEEARENDLGEGVRVVLLREEIAGSKPAIYDQSLAHCWIAYIDEGPEKGISASTVVLIDRKSGEVVYRGSAYDEG